MGGLHTLPFTVTRVCGFLPATGIEKEQRGHRTVSCIPGRGRMFPHSGQKFGSPPKHDIAVGGESLSIKLDSRGYRRKPQ